MKRSRSRIYCADCIEKMRQWPDNYFDSIVSDPPYGIAFMGKHWDTMSNREFQEFSRRWATEALRILKPGGHLLAFAGSRTYHRMVCGIEDAGFDIRDTIMWMYGSGFPKSLNVAKAIDAKILTGKTESSYLKQANALRSGKGKARKSRNNGIMGDEQTTVVKHTLITPEAKKWSGYGTAIKPAIEPIVVARKPLIGTVVDNVLIHRTGAINIDGCRIGYASVADKREETRGRHSSTKGYEGLTKKGGAFAEKGTKVITPPNGLGRWPANVVHDGSPEVLALFPTAGGGDNRVPVYGKRGSGFYNVGSGINDGQPQSALYSDTGSAARFYYCAKVSRAEREYGLDALAKKQGEWFNTANGTSDKPSSIAANRAERAPRANNHPTVKPIDLMRWLITLVTPPGGTVLDPFTGSGSTGVAAVKHGFRFVGIERERDYAKMAALRIRAAEHDRDDTRQLDRIHDKLYGRGLFT